MAFTIIICLYKSKKLKDMAGFRSVKVNLLRVCWEKLAHCCPDAVAALRPAKPWGASNIFFLFSILQLLSGYKNQLRRRVGQDFKALSNPLKFKFYRFNN
jgi:hypothetical protein